MTITALQSTSRFGSVITFNNNPQDQGRDGVERFQPHVFQAYCELRRAGVTDALVPIQYGPAEHVAQQQILVNGEQGIMAAAICIAANKMVKHGAQAAQVAKAVGIKLEQVLKINLPGAIYPYLGSAYPRNIYHGQVFTNTGESRDIESFFPIK